MVDYLTKEQDIDIKVFVSYKFLGLVSFNVLIFRRITIYFVILKLNKYKLHDVTLFFLYGKNSANSKILNLQIVFSK